MAVMNQKEDVDFTKYGYIPPEKEEMNTSNSNKKEDVDFTKYGYIPSEEEEGLGSAIGMAIPRVAKDLGELILNKISLIPDYLKSSKTEIPGLMDLMVKNASHNLNQLSNGKMSGELSPIQKQLMAGLAELGQGAFNLPHDVANYSTNRLHLLPNDLNKKIQMARMPDDTEQMINQQFGEATQPGEKLARGLSRNINQISLATGIASLLNPLKLTDKGIVKSVLKAEKENVGKFSGPYGEYTKNAEKAKTRGITGDQINPDKNDLSILKKDMPSDEFEAIDKLMNNKNIQNAQNAISQLGFRERKLITKSKRGDILSDPEKNLLRAIQNTKQHIQQNMFKDSSGKIHEDLVAEHKGIQTGYRKEVIPYTKNKALQEYKAGDKLKDDLVSSLMRGKFPAQRGSAHKALMIRRWIEKHPKTSVGLGIFGAHAGGIPLGLTLYKHLFGEENAQ